MDVSDRLLCLYSAAVEQRDGQYVIEVPQRELEIGDLSRGSTYAVGVLPVSTEGAAQSARESPGEDRYEGAPVGAGDELTVEIETIGDQGDGIARVERGFVVIVPDTERGERVEIEITDVRESVAFGHVIERLSYYD